MHVRFTLKADKIVEPPCRSALCQKRTYAPQQYRRYSITSSARSGNAGGMVNPITLAAFILITSSYLVGA